MSLRQSTSIRPPLATRQRVNNMSADVTLPTKPSWETETKFASPETAYIQNEEDVKMVKALEDASRLFECGWSGCDASLGSWGLLKRHVEKIHCKAFSSEMLEKASSSRPYRCHYASCQNRIYSEPWQLGEHVNLAHLDSLRLRCPFGCKQPVAKLQALRLHLSSVHAKGISGLPCARIRPAPLRRASLPKLATDAPMALDCVAQVKPCVTFNATNVRSEIGRDPWADFAELDEGDEIRPFARLMLPQNGRIPYDIRLIPKGRLKYDGLQKPKGDATCMNGETVGYESWKRQFDAQAQGAGLEEPTRQS